MTWLRKILAGSLALFLTWAAGSIVTAQNERPLVQVRSESAAGGERVTLGDLAEIRARDEGVAERLRAVALGYAPNVGLVRELSRDRILLAISAAGFNAGELQFECPAQVLIRRRSQEVDAALIRVAVERVALAGLTASGATARLARLDLPPMPEAPTGSVEVRAVMGTATNLFVPFPVFIELWVDGRITSRFSATALVEAHAPVIVPVRDLAAGTRLRREDFTLAVRRLDRPVSSYLRDLNGLRGLTLRRTIANGEALVADALVADIIMRPGDVVRILAQSGQHAADKGCLQIVVEGEARGTGRVGERIPVRNRASGVIIQAKVVDEGLVQVVF